jgi:hypothetical protein
VHGSTFYSWIVVAPEGIKTKRQLGPWIARGIAFAGALPPKA